jgi:CP family cyanate transporter-like MFS transporter
MATGIYSVGIMLGLAVPLAVTMPTVFPITDTYQGVFLFWSIPAIVATALWWIIVKEPHRNGMESKTPSVGTPFLRVIRNKHLWLVSILFVLHNFFFFAWTGWAPHLLMAKGASDTLAGLITSIFPWVGIPTVLLMPRLAYKIGLRKPFLWVPAIIMAMASLGAIYMNLNLSWLVMAIVGIANNTRFITVLTLPVEMVPEKDVGTASGLILSIGHMGGVIGAWVGGRILDLTGSLDIVMLILVGISAATAGIALRLPETGRKAAEHQP